LEGAIKNSELIVTESDIEIGALTAIIDFSEKHKKALFVSLSSEAHAAEFLSRSALTDPIYAISVRLNDLVGFCRNDEFLSSIKGEVQVMADALREAVSVGNTAERGAQLGLVAQTICRALNAKHVVCVDMQNNAYAFLSVAPSATGSAILMPFDKNVISRAVEDGNLTGIRDGIFSSFIHLSYRPAATVEAKMQPDLDLYSKDIQRRSVGLASRYMGPIAKAKGATPNAVVSWAEEPVHWTFSVWRYLVLINEAAPLLFWLVPILFFLFAWLFALLGIAFDLPWPTEWRLPDWSRIKRVFGK